MTPPAAASAATRTLPRRSPATAPRPRRVSGPTRRPTTAPKPRTRQSPAQSEGLVVGALRSLDTLSSHRLLDRLIRGRLWIGIVAFALIGIVTLQLGLLKLNSGIGRAIERESSLQRENAALSIENSELAAGNRVESQAARLGMQLVPMASLKFLSSHARTDVPRAAARLREPLHASTQAPEASNSAEATAGEQSSEAAAGTTASGSGEAEQQTSSSTGEASPSGETAGSGEATTSTTGEATAPATASPQTPTSAGGETSSEAGGGTAGPAG